MEGKVDHLRGLKENVIMGRLIPAGTGIDQDKQVKAEVASLAAPSAEPSSEEGAEATEAEPA